MYKVLRIKLKDEQLDILENCKGSFAPEKRGISSDYFKNLQIIEDSGNREIDMIEKMNTLFPLDNYDVFLSHSHNDLLKAQKLKKYLETYLGLSVFLDSEVWENSTEFLKSLDNKYCKNEHENTYNYDKRNFSTTHVHMMLAASILKMIDKAECVLLFATDNYAKNEDSGIEQMDSAWIYYEYLVSQHIKPKSLGRSFKHKAFDESAKFEDKKPFEPIYKVDFKDIPLIEYSAIKKLHTLGLIKTDYLDKLYELYTK